MTLDAFVIEYGYKPGIKYSIPYILSSLNILSFSGFGKLCTPCQKFQSARKITFQNRLCEKLSLETLVQSISQPHKIFPLHFHNIREVVNYPNQSSSIRFDSIRFSLYSTRFDSVHFFKFRIRFDLIRLNRIESNRIELFDNSIRFRSLTGTTVNLCAMIVTMIQNINILLQTIAGLILQVVPRLKQVLPVKGSIVYLVALLHRIKLILRLRT